MRARNKLARALGRLGADVEFQSRLSNDAFGTALQSSLIDAGEDLSYGQLTATDSGEVSHADGRRWRVALEEREVEGVVSSCGDAPKKGQAIVATGVEPVAG